MNTIVTSKEDIYPGKGLGGGQYPFCRLGMRGLGRLDLQLL